MWLEEAFGCFKSFASDANHAAIGEGVGLHEHRSILAQALVEAQIVGDVAELFFDLSDCLKVGGTIESVATAKKESNEVAGYIAAGHVKAARKVVENGRFVDRDDVSDAITRVDNYSGRQALRVKSKDCLNGNIDATEVVSVEHDLAHALAVLEWVHGRFRQKDLAAGCVYLEFLIESEVPEMLHVIPFLYDAVFHLSSGAGQEMGHLGRLE